MAGEEGRIWRISDNHLASAPGSIYVFLPNGTLLETSCVETYRIATWFVDPSDPKSLRVVEDRQPVFSASLGEDSAKTLHLRRKFPRSAEEHDVTLTAADGEFVCPDLPK